MPFTILSPCFCVAFAFFLASCCLPCFAAAHTVRQCLVTQPWHFRGLWAPGFAQVNSKLTMELQAEHRASSTELWLRNARLCPPPRDGQIPQYMLIGDELHPEIACAQAGSTVPNEIIRSPMTQSNPPAFDNVSGRPVLADPVAGSWLFKIFLCLTVRSALLCGVTHCRRATGTWDAVPNGNLIMPWLCFCCGLSWRRELESGRPLNSCDYLFQGKWITAQSCMIRAFGGWGSFGWWFFTELLKYLTLQFYVPLIQFSHELWIHIHAQYVCAWLDKPDYVKSWILGIKSTSRVHLELNWSFTVRAECSPFFLCFFWDLLIQTFNLWCFSAWCFSAFLWLSLIIPSCPTFPQN